MSRTPVSPGTWVPFVVLELSVSTKTGLRTADAVDLVEREAGVLDGARGGVDSERDGVDQESAADGGLPGSDGRLTAGVAPGKGLTLP